MLFIIFSDTGAGHFPLSTLNFHISNGHKIWGQRPFSVQSRIFPKLRAQILQMRYQLILKGSGFPAERKKI